MAKTAVKMVNGKLVAVDPDAEEVSPEMEAILKAKQAATTAKNRTDAETEEMRQNPINKAKGGMVKKAGGGAVRGVGCATKGKGKGTIY